VLFSGPLGGFSFGSSIRLIAGVLFFVSLLLQALGFLGLGRRYASRIGYGVFAYGLAAGTLWLVSFAIGTLAFMTLITFVELLIILVASILVFVFFIVEGAALITVRDLTLMRGASVASGILFVIAGALLCSLFLSPVGFVVLVPANVIGGILFLRGFRRLPGHMIFSLQGNAPLL
jgi:hypothetical protein